MAETSYPNTLVYECSRENAKVKISENHFINEFSEGIELNKGDTVRILGSFINEAGSGEEIEITEDNNKFTLSYVPYHNLFEYGDPGKAYQLPTPRVAKPDENLQFSSQLTYESVKTANGQNGKFFDRDVAGNSRLLNIGFDPTGFNGFDLGSINRETNCNQLYADAELVKSMTLVPLDGYRVVDLQQDSNGAYLDPSGFNPQFQYYPFKTPDILGANNWPRPDLPGGQDGTTGFGSMTEAKGKDLRHSGSYGDGAYNNCYIASYYLCGSAPATLGGADREPLSEIDFEAGPQGMTGRIIQSRWLEWNLTNTTGAGDNQMVSNGRLQAEGNLGTGPLTGYDVYEKNPGGIVNGSQINAQDTFLLSVCIDNHILHSKVDYRDRADKNTYGDPSAPTKRQDNDANQVFNQQGPATFQGRTDTYEGSVATSVSTTGQDDEYLGPQAGGFQMGYRNNYVVNADKAKPDCRKQVSANNMSFYECGWCGSYQIPVNGGTASSTIMNHNTFGLYTRLDKVNLDIELGDSSAPPDSNILTILVQNLQDIKDRKITSQELGFKVLYIYNPEKPYEKNTAQAQGGRFYMAINGGPANHTPYSTRDPSVPVGDYTDFIYNIGGSGGGLVNGGSPEPGYNNNEYLFTNSCGNQPYSVDPQVNLSKYSHSDLVDPNLAPPGVNFNLMTDTITNNQGKRDTDQIKRIQEGSQDFLKIEQKRATIEIPTGFYTQDRLANTINDILHLDYQGYIPEFGKDKTVITGVKKDSAYQYAPACVNGPFLYTKHPQLQYLVIPPSLSTSDQIEGEDDFTRAPIIPVNTIKQDVLQDETLRWERNGFSIVGDRQNPIVPAILTKNLADFLPEQDYVTFMAFPPFRQQADNDTYSSIKRNQSAPVISCLRGAGPNQSPNGVTADPTSAPLPVGASPVTLGQGILGIGQQAQYASASVGLAPRPFTASEQNAPNFFGVNQTVLNGDWSGTTTEGFTYLNGFISCGNSMMYLGGLSRYWYGANDLTFLYDPDEEKFAFSYTYSPYRPSGFETAQGQSTFTVGDAVPSTLINLNYEGMFLYCISQIVLNELASEPISKLTASTDYREQYGTGNNQGPIQDLTTTGLSTEWKKGISFWDTVGFETGTDILPSIDEDGDILRNPDRLYNINPFFQVDLNQRVGHSPVQTVVKLDPAINGQNPFKSSCTTQFPNREFLLQTVSDEFKATKNAKLSQYPFYLISSSFPSGFYHGSETGTELPVVGICARNFQAFDFVFDLSQSSVEWTIEQEVVITSIETRILKNDFSDATNLFGNSAVIYAISKNQYVKGIPEPLATQIEQEREKMIEKEANAYEKKPLTIQDHSTYIGGYLVPMTQEVETDTEDED